MIDANAVYPILALIAIYAAAFFLSPHRLADFWERDDLPVHMIMQNFRIWESRRTWVAAVGLAASLFLSPAFGSGVIFMVAMFLGLACLWGADALQFRAISQHSLSVS